MACNPCSDVSVPSGAPARHWWDLSDGELVSELSECDLCRFARWNARRTELKFLLPIPLNIFARCIGARRRGHRWRRTGW